MATDTNSNLHPSGTIGGLNLYQLGDITVIRQKASPDGNRKRTLGRMLQRVKMDNVVEGWKQSNGCLEQLFETERPTQKSYHRFVSLNLKQARVYLTHEESLRHACVLDHFVVADGSIPLEINIEERDGWMVSSLAMGEGELTEKSPVNELLFRLNKNNRFRFMEGDRLHFVRMTQLTQEGSGLPYVRTEQACVELGGRNQHPLYGTVCADQMAIHEGFLAVPARENSMVAWALTREERKRKRRLCTHAEMCGSNSFLDQYTNDEAIRQAMESYKTLQM